LHQLRDLERDRANADRQTAESRFAAAPTNAPHANFRQATPIEADRLGNASRGQSEIRPGIHEEARCYITVGGSNDNGNAGKREDAKGGSPFGQPELNRR
jgi:hypothetical protein